MNLKTLIKQVVLGSKVLRRPAISYCSNNVLLPSVLTQTSPSVLRDMLLLPHSKYVTQLNQDIFALLINQFKPGFFIEIGANDGFTLSNTNYLEENFGWKGLLIEANPQYLETLNNRKSKSVISAVADKEGFFDFCSAGLYGGITDTLDNVHVQNTQNANFIKVRGTTLDRLMDENNVPALINFISIDIEGGEATVVEQMCCQRDRRFVCGCIEYNSREEDYLKIKHLLEGVGYSIVWEGQTQQDLFFVDRKA